MSDAQTENQSKVSQVKANPTMSTLDALVHERDLETQRQKRKDSTVEVKADAYTPSRNDMVPLGADKSTVNGYKTEQNLSDEYVMEELEALKEPQKIGKPSPTPVIENEDEIPSEDD